MKAYDIKPTYDNLLKTFTENIIGRNADLFHFVSILNSIENSCAIAIDGNWGSGKTFFVKQTKMILDAHNEHIPRINEVDRDKIMKAHSAYYGNKLQKLQPQVCVYYDAWENDNDDDPILSLVYTILNCVDNDFSFKEASCIKIAASIMEIFSGRNWSQLISSFKGENPLESLKQSKDVEQLVHEFLESLLPERGNRLIVFIDELDRCKPSYAVRLLERIKHYFSDDKITFVFSINTKELQHTIRKHYGNEFDGSRYLDRFFDLRVTLPPPDLQSFYRSLDFNDSYYTFDIVCGVVIKAYNFELREIAKYLRLTKIAAYVPTHDSSYHFGFSTGKSIQFCLFYVVPIMIGLKVSNANRYANFIEGKDYTPLIEIVNALPKRMFEELLNFNETYDENITNKKTVTVEDKLKAIYDALFVKVYNGEGYSTKIGEMQFEVSTKETLLRITGLLSKYTKMDVD